MEDEVKDEVISDEIVSNNEKVSEGIESYRSEKEESFVEEELIEEMPVAEKPKGNANIKVENVDKSDKSKLISPPEPEEFVEEPLTESDRSDLDLDNQESHVVLESPRKPEAKDPKYNTKEIKEIAK